MEQGNMWKWNPKYQTLLCIAYTTFLNNYFSIIRIKSNFQIEKYDLDWDDKQAQCTGFDLKTQLSLIAVSEHIHQHISNRCEDIQFVEKQKLSFNRGKGQHKVLVVLASPSQN